MKTTDLTFLEAIQALAENKCAGIKPVGWIGAYVLNRVDAVCYFTPAVYLGKWELADVRKEKHEIKGFINIFATIDGRITTGKVHSTEEIADIVPAKSRRIACVPVTLEYETEVE